ncbi:kinase subunit of RNA polymerase II carboxy-terminal domain kinase I [Paramarasmius palmivorus]|uniref:[RNA-polymerase]-subunit kinase n=1 Tax=Paramarasmius palmivorus TaxID=297713 RepID=A0AAW0DG70_9AGAR
MAREPSSSRNTHEQDSWRSEHSDDRYSYHSGYGRGGGRGEYNVGESRDSGWSGRRRSDSHYTQQREEWPPRSDHGYSSSYQEPQPVWDPQPDSSYDSRAAPYARWQDEDHAAQQHLDRDLDRNIRQRDVHEDRDREMRWHREDRRDAEPERVSDMGWEPRHRQSSRRNWEERDNLDRPPSPEPERSWEPAESWKSSHREESNNYRHHNFQRQNGHSKHYKGNQKKNYRHNKDKKDKKNNDDSHLNKGETASLLNEVTKALLEENIVAILGRAHVPQPTPITLIAHTILREIEVVVARCLLRLSACEENRVLSYLTTNRLTGDDGIDLPRKGRRRSVSSASTMSSDRSRSRSPLEKTRAVHRLPTASAPTGTFQRNENRPKKNQRNGGRRNKSSAMATANVEQMPPPPVPHLPSRPEYEYQHQKHNLSSSDGMEEAPTASRPPSGKAGFKPIGQQPSSMKLFFPGDDDDMDLSADSSTSTRIQDYQQEETVEIAEPRPMDEPEPRYPMDKRESTGDYRDHYPNGVQHPVQNQQPAPGYAPWISSEPDHGWGWRSWEHSKPPTPPAVAPTPASQSEVYMIVSQVGEGTFGKVYKARNTATGAHVALKRIRMEAEKEGFPVTAMREIKLLQSLRHNNVIRLHEMMVSSGSVYMVFEYMDHDLTGVLSQTQFAFSKAHLKSLCHQMLAGLGYLHHKGVIHRDIKGSNILINNRGELKLADFGLARFYQKRRRADYTNRVITLWYRPPELLFGATIYGPEVDMWSAGCIMLELFTKKPVFQGNDEISQLDTIYRIIGTPNRERWGEVANLPWYELVKPKDVIPNHFRELFQKWMSPAALDLAERLLDYDPARRISATDAMQALYFTAEDPPAEPPVGLATLEGEWHELETKRERAKKRKKE